MAQILPVIVKKTSVFHVLPTNYLKKCKFLVFFIQNSNQRVLKGDRLAIGGGFPNLKLRG